MPEHASGFSVSIGFIALFYILMVVRMAKKRAVTEQSFLVANRNVSWIRGGISIAVSWVWAPAIFIASMQAYTKGIAGAFWFTVPNVLCFFLFVPLAVRLRKLIPHGHTVPEFIVRRYENDARTHLAFSTIFFGYQLGAIIVNSLAGGLLLNSLTGMSFSLAVILTAGVALSYSIISGLEASILTDIFQLAIYFIVCLLIVPWVIGEAGGIDAVYRGFGGVSGEFANPLHPGIAYSFGIATCISLLSGPIGDQMFFQRSFAVHQTDIFEWGTTQT